MEDSIEALAALAIDEAYDYIEESLTRVHQLAEEQICSEDSWEEVYIICERVINILMLVDEHLTEYDTSGELREKVNRCSDEIVQIVVEAANSMPQSHSNPPGRPRLAIPADQLAFLLGCYFRQSDIAAMFKCSPRTIQRRIVEFGLEGHITYDCISDSELDEITSAYVARFPMAGAKSFCGFLQYKVHRQRARDSMARVDPIGVQARLRQTIRTRAYSVPMPNSVWHIDRYHKLIRWQIIIHGGIDGYSRLPVYLVASNNNRSDTVLKAFLRAVNSFGIPSRVRADKGTENVLVSLFMLCHPSRGPGRGSFITGRSIHNQRIERFWRDLFAGCVVYFYHLFRQLEDDSHLDPDNLVDIFCLHFCFLPIINHHLRVFFEFWSNHQMRTCENRSPLQLWIQGFMSRPEEDPSAVLGLSTIDSLVHSEHTELHSAVGDQGESSEYEITVPPNPIEEQLTQVGILDLLYASINTAELSCEEATNVYLALRDTIARCI